MEILNPAASQPTRHQRGCQHHRRGVSLRLIHYIQLHLNGRFVNMCALGDPTPSRNDCAAQAGIPLMLRNVMSRIIEIIGDALARALSAH